MAMNDEMGHAYYPSDIYGGTSDEELGLWVGMSKSDVVKLSDDIQIHFGESTDADDYLVGVYEYLVYRLSIMEDE